MCFEAIDTAYAHIHELKKSTRVAVMHRTCATCVDWLPIQTLASQLSSEAGVGDQSTIYKSTSADQLWIFLLVNVQAALKRCRDLLILRLYYDCDGCP
jgi:hypothetical protein